MALTTRHRVTIEDLPDEVLEHVFVLAGRVFCPAIVGVSKRWWRVCWGSKALWRHLIMSRVQADPPMVTPAPPAAAAAEAGQLLPFEEVQRRQEQRMQAYQAAQWAQLRRAGHLAEVATLMYPTTRVAPVAPMLQQLSPEALADLALFLPELEEEHAQLVAGFTRLHSLTLHAPRGCERACPALGQLARLQSLTLGASEMDPQLVAAVLSLTGLTRLELGSAFFPSLLGLTKLQQLRHFSVDAWDRELPSDEPTQLPTPSSFVALQSYRSSGTYVYGGLQLAGFRFQALVFTPLPNAAGGLAAHSTTHSHPAGAQPGTLRMDGCAAELGAEEDAAGEEAPGGPTPLPPSLNTLLEAALPPRCTLQHLVLECCDLGAVSLQRLPVLAGLQCLEVRQCWGAGGMDAPLQALVQRAPALTSLAFDAQMPDEPQHSAYRLHSWPTYLLARPSLCSATRLNRQEAQWDSEQAMLPSIAVAEPVLEELCTDSFASLPPQLATVTGLRSLDLSSRLGVELTASAVDTLLALPHLASLKLPQLSEAGQQVAEQLGIARPDLHVQIASN